ncbi:hypothetical protein [Dictyobacter arantiisoli]|uniref:Uncharacterized protein n=1 Tax=Dictyobacter arantiisoli TaxID=2014874 RepID=A0A5A5TI96_9CHLR|nr:hypothetical protein [Dictyobacter arantiisoli]GCF10729.1 hypothetical protein KDI_42930 [Dictyobacter arantiisoli]
MGTTYTRRQPAYYDVEDRDDLYETRMPSSARRYKPYETIDDPLLLQQQYVSSIQRRRSSGNTTKTSSIKTSSVYPTRHTGSAASRAVRPSKTVDMRRNDYPIQNDSRRSKRFNPALIIGMIVAVVVMVGLTFLVSWWQGFQQDITYGYPRTAQIDAVVGHNDSTAHPTHFVFINLHGQIEVIEFPGGDTSKPRIFNGPPLSGSGQDLIPVTGNTVNQQGKINLIVHVGSQDFLFVNDGKTFHPR